MNKLLSIIKKPKSNKPRIYFLDEIRGAAVFCMVFYHGFYTFSQIFNNGFFTVLLNIFSPLEPAFAVLFIFISGICENLSHSNVIRGLKLAVVAAAITVVTIFVVPDQAIYFGILHLLSASMILVGLTMKYLNKLPALPFMAVCLALFLFTYPIDIGYLGFYEIPIIPLPSVLYQNNFFCWLGFHTFSFSSADYFPLLPWIFPFIAGALFGRYAKAGRFPKWMYKNHVPFFTFIGRHALIIYIVHQPIFYLIGMIFSH